jgi:hypothetical protein
VPFVKPPAVQERDATEAGLVPKVNVLLFKLTAPNVKVNVPDTVPVLVTPPVVLTRELALLKVTPWEEVLLTVIFVKFAEEVVVLFRKTPVPLTVLSRSRWAN